MSDEQKACLKALRKLGYKKCQMQLTRMAKTYSPGGEMGARPMVSVGAHTVMVHSDRYFFSPSLIHVQNLKSGVADSVSKLTTELRERGCCEEKGVLGFDVLHTSIDGGSDAGTLFREAETGIISLGFDQEKRDFQAGTRWCRRWDSNPHEVALTGF